MHTAESLKQHPHLNPAYFPRLDERAAARAANRQIAEMERRIKQPLRRVPVPKQANRYLPHMGAKERARHVGKISFGENASRAPHPSTEARRSACPAAASVEPQFNIADQVRWTSSGKLKVGVVKAILRAGELPRDADCRVKDATSPRDHVSFVVAVGNTLYWPRVSLLERA